MRHGAELPPCWYLDDPDLWVGLSTEIELGCPCVDGLCGCEQNDPH